MDLFWSGLAQRASEHTWNERRSQFSKVHEMVIQKIKAEKQNSGEFVFNDGALPRKYKLLGQHAR